MKVSDSGNGSFEQAPVGAHVARCIKLIDIGTQHGEYQGKPNSRRQVVVMWELQDELMTDGEQAGKPFIVSKWYTASLGEKANLRADLVNWRGREFTPEELHGFDLKNILDKCCLVQVTQNDKGKSRVSGVMALPKGNAPKPRVNPLTYLSLDPAEFDRKTFDQLGEYWQKLISGTPEFGKLSKPASTPALDAMDEEEIPF